MIKLNCFIGCLFVAVLVHASSERSTQQAPKKYSSTSTSIQENLYGRQEDYDRQESQDVRQEIGNEISGDDTRIHTEDAS